MAAFGSIRTLLGQDLGRPVWDATKETVPWRPSTFDNKALAEKWARSVEGEIDVGLAVDRRAADRTSLAEVLERYHREVTPTKQGAADENLRLNAMALRPFTRVRMSALTSSLLAAYRDQRLQVVSGATVNREFNVLSHAIETARREWDIYLQVNPATSADADRIVSISAVTSKRSSGAQWQVAATLGHVERRGGPLRT